MKCREPHADIKIEVDRNNRGISGLIFIYVTCILGLNEVKTTHQFP